MDVTNIQFPNESFDAIYCSHVLEHVPEDQKAMQELFRVLKPGGWALLQVPLELERERTYED
jgi:ubiquinone/menaquinone biosynthesis C-methylase UbiE